jgi:LacI family transcriptional regulator
VARLAQVSKKTVSRVINQSLSVSVETRERVEAVIAELGYSPDPQAQGLAFRRSFVIGFIYNNPNPQYIVNAQQGILDAARQRGFELMVRPCDLSSPTLLEDMRAFVERQKLFGVIMFPRVSEDERLADLLAGLGCPYVRVASVALDDPESMIVSHDGEGAYEAARHLAALGHRRIALITGPKSFRSAHERRRGFEAGLASSGLTLDPRYVAEGAYTFESGVAQADALLRREARPTAICTLNDEMAAGVYRAAHVLGLSIPCDLSVVGFDDAPIATRLWPPLTTVLLPIREMGRRAAEALMAGLGGSESQTPPPRITPSLIVRDSTAEPA